jgi:hypothetical protein
MFHHSDIAHSFFSQKEKGHETLSSKGHSREKKGTVLLTYEDKFTSFSDFCVCHQSADW